MSNEVLKKINIRPDVGMLGLLKNQNYKPWYALAEFIDNALDSYLKNKKRLFAIEGENYKLKITIEANKKDNKIVIKDNAAGISTDDYDRAFKAAGMPSDRSGLSEFGIGMKQAAFWFCPSWKVTTSALDEPFERIIEFNLDKIMAENIQELEVIQISKDANRHYTIIELQEIHNKIPEKNGIGTVKKHLASIYREFIRNGELELWWNDEELLFQEVKILNAIPYYKNASTEQKIEWKKEINFPIDDKLSAKGFVALRETGSPKEAGLALFRRGRIIEGSLDETFRPESIFGAKQGFRHQRLFGELHLEGFQVSHTKDGFQWDDKMEIFLDLLKDLIKAEPSLWKQAETYSAREEQKKGDSKFSETTQNIPIEQVKTPTAQEIKEIESEPMPYISTPINSTQPVFIERVTTKKFSVTDGSTNWKITVLLKNEEIPNDWFEIKDEEPDIRNKKSTERNLKIQITTNHPYMEKYVRGNEQTIEAILRVVVSLAIAETIVLDTGGQYAKRLRDNLNKFLKQNF